MSTLSGRHLRISTVAEPLWQVHERDGTWSGISFALLDMMAQWANFTYTVSEPRDCTYGSIDANGRWSGILGALQRREADVGALLSRTSERTKHFRASFALFHSRTQVVISLDAVNGGDGGPWAMLCDAFRALQVFSPSVWIALGLVMILIVAVATMAERSVNRMRSSAFDVFVRLLSKVSLCVDTAI